MAYLKLFHGRHSPDDELQGWGDDGPIFGPYPYFHTVYGTEILFDQAAAHSLPIVDGLVFYGGAYYGDWSVFDGTVDIEDRDRLTTFDAPRALLPEDQPR